MSLYRLGTNAGAVAVPPGLQHAADRALMVRDGASWIRTGESRFYGRGLTVGAETPGPVGTLVDAVLGLILDVAHVLLLVGGMLLLWRGLVG